MKKILLIALLFAGFTSFSQVQNGGLATENGSKFFFSTVNSSTAQLAAAATFTGTVESILSQRSYSILFFSDQNATITINQFIDAGGTKNAQQLVFTYLANAKFARSGALNGNYIQVTVQNTGGSTTTTLALDMAYGNIDAATGLNNSPHALMEINGTAVDQNSGNKSAGSQRVVIATDDINLAAINTNTTQSSFITGQATQTAAGNNIVLATAGTGSTDVSNVKAIAIQIVPTGTVSSGVVTFEGSNDNVTFVAIPLYDEASLTANPISTVSPATGVSRYFLGPLYWKFFRARISTVIGGGGSLQALTIFSQSPYQPDVYTVTQATGANLNAAISSLPTLATVTTVGTVTTLANGQTAHSTASTGSPLRIGGRVLPATSDLTLVAGDASDLGITSGQQALTKDFSSSELDYAFIGSINNSTTANVFKNAAGSSIRNYVTNIILNSDALTVATEVVVKDGLVTSTSVAANVLTSGTHDYKIGDQVVFTNIATYTGIVVGTIYYILTVPSTTTYTLSTTPNGSTAAVTGSGSATSNRILFRTKLQTASFGPTGFTFPTPLRGSPNNTLDVQTVTATTVGVVYYNISGYIGF